jgi:8-oxo-dGTP diphosphatase
MKSSRGRRINRAISVGRKPPAPPADRRAFPQHPRVGVGGIVIRGADVLLIRRGQPPLKGRWSIPGGLVEVGETLNAALAREIEEETGLRVRVLRMLGVFERIIHARRARGKVQYHYVLIDFLCEPRAPRRGSGRRDTLQPSTDVVDARWVSRDDLGRFRLSTATRDAIDEAFRMLDSAS